MDLIADLRSEILAALPHRPEDRAALGAMATSHLLIAYWNWMNRGPPQLQYKIHRSTELDDNPLTSAEPYRTALQHIVQLLEAGSTVTPHLSRGIAFGFDPNQGTKKNLKRRRDLDLMLNDWGVHHLHLSTSIEADGFVTRTRPLLFAAFRGSDAYLIDILDHSGWASDAIPLTILHNWPSAGLMHELKGFLGAGEAYSANEKLALREAGIETPFEFEGKTYLFRSGLTTAGTSHLAVRGAGQLLDTIAAFEKLLRDRPHYIAETLTEGGVTPPPEPDLHFVFLQSGYGVVERKTNSLFRLAK